MDMHNFVAEVRAIQNSKWDDYQSELNTVRDATWPDVETYITMWEVIAKVKEFPNGDND